MKGVQLEVALRLRSDKGALLDEYVIRGNRVELINYFPSGGIQARVEVTLDAFIAGVKRLTLSDNPIGMPA